jgi:hypothetical protein
VQAVIKAPLAAYAEESDIQRADESPADAG